MNYHVAAHRKAGVPIEVESVTIYFNSNPPSGLVLNQDESTDLCTVLASLFDKKRVRRVSADRIVELYNNHAKKNGWQQCRTLPETLRRSIQKATKHYPEESQWHTILKGWESNDFFSGKSGIYDRIKIRTMLFKNRYAEFYEDGLDVDDTKDDFLSQLDSFASHDPFREKKIAMGIIPSGDQDA